MIRSFKEIAKELKNRREKKRERDEEGRVIVNLRVRDDEGFLSPYSSENHNVLSEETAAFIEKSLNPIPAEEHIHFRVYSDVITPQEAEQYTEAIHEHYADCYEQVRFQKKRYLRMALIMAFIAVVALSFAIGFEVSGNKTAVIAEVIDIFAWVFMWEAVDIFFLERVMLNLKQRRYLALTDSVVEYLPLSERENKENI